jgi:DNA-binding response OmpR family regulator
MQGVISHEQGLNLIQTAKPEVILLDLIQTDSESWSLYQAVKSEKKWAGIPIIDVSARVSERGRLILHEELSPALDLERVIRSVKVLAQKSRDIIP